MPNGHHHLHTQDGTCYGDYEVFDYAIDTAALIQDSWRTPWGVPAITVIDAPCCFPECKEE